MYSTLVAQNVQNYFLKLNATAAALAAMNAPNVQ